MSEQPTSRRSLVPGPPGRAPENEIMARAALTTPQNGPQPPATSAQKPGGWVYMTAPAVPEETGHLAGAIASVMANVGTIQKGGINQYHGYRYARMEDLLYAITPLMGKAGLAVIQDEREITTL